MSKHCMIPRKSREGSLNTEKSKRGGNRNRMSQSKSKTHMEKEGWGDPEVAAAGQTAGTGPAGCSRRPTSEAGVRSGQGAGAAAVDEMLGALWSGRSRVRPTRWAWESGSTSPSLSFPV